MPPPPCALKIPAMMGRRSATGWPGSWPPSIVARAQTGYDPESGVIELRGHVKSNADRDVLMAALQTGLQGALPIRDRLRRLPAPQCDVLTAFADMPLPQSVEQFTNPLIIGDDLHARVYEFVDGDSIRFELQGADYPGWLYLDYYDNEGRVLHLLPNATIPPLRLSAREILVFGGGGTTDVARGKLELRVSPPFGEDIVVAMVTSEPLFDGTRPTVEEAEPYLTLVERLVAEARSRSDEFRGEWVYLFVGNFVAVRIGADRSASPGATADETSNARAPVLQCARAGADDRSSNRHSAGSPPRDNRWRL